MLEIAVDPLGLHLGGGSCAIWCLQPDSHGAA